MAVKNRGYILDSFPKTLLEARHLFSEPRKLTAAELEATAPASSSGRSSRAQKDEKKGKAGSTPDELKEPRALCLDIVPNALVGDTGWRV